MLSTKLFFVLPLSNPMNDNVRTHNADVKKWKKERENRKERFRPSHEFGRHTRFEAMVYSSVREKST